MVKRIEPLRSEFFENLYRSCSTRKPEEQGEPIRRSSHGVMVFPIDFGHNLQDRSDFRETDGKVGGNRCEERDRM